MISVLSKLRPPNSRSHSENSEELCFTARAVACVTFGYPADLSSVSFQLSLAFGSGPLLAMGNRWPCIDAAIVRRGGMTRIATALSLSILLGTTLAPRANAQQINGTPGSPSATITID